MKLLCHSLSILAPAYSVPEVRVFNLIYIVTLKCSCNLGNCDFTVMFYQNEIFFVAKTTDLSLSNLKPLSTNFNGQSFLASF